MRAETITTVAKFIQISYDGSSILFKTFHKWAALAYLYYIIMWLNFNGK